MRKEQGESSIIKGRACGAIEKMSPENGRHLLESDATGLNFKETELSLRMPGETRSGAIEVGAKAGMKRGFSQTVDLNLGRSNDECHEKVRQKSESDGLDVAKPPAAK